ncbi:hypothetical protein PR048_019751 [Dryococelus australis]|uniref:Uncharacterized protein n=1 Tax=Dryococelus australis TaxID=614101 RepID=A0ABQ9H4G9_9NEOP|nr:hypothetical protein PR048_019751 [Dryococelus australis]
MATAISGTLICKLHTSWYRHIAYRIVLYDTSAVGKCKGAMGKTTHSLFPHPSSLKTYPPKVLRSPLHGGVRRTRAVATNLEEEDRSFRHEGEGGTEEYGHSSAHEGQPEGREHTAHSVGEQYADDEQVLVEAAQEAPDLLLRYLGRVDGAGYGERSAGHSRKKAASVQHLHLDSNIKILPGTTHDNSNLGMCSLAHSDQLPMTSSGNFSTCLLAHICSHSHIPSCISTNSFALNTLNLESQYPDQTDNTAPTRQISVATNEKGSEICLEADWESVHSTVNGLAGTHRGRPYDESPTDDVGDDEEQHGVLAADAVHDVAHGQDHGGGAEGHEGADPGQLCIAPDSSGRPAGDVHARTVPWPNAPSDTGTSTANGRVVAICTSSSVYVACSRERHLITVRWSSEECGVAKDPSLTEIDSSWCAVHAGESAIWAALNIEVLKPVRVKRGEYGVALEYEGGGKLEIPEKTHRLGASSGTIHMCEYTGAAPPGIEPVSSKWEAIPKSTRTESEIDECNVLGGSYHRSLNKTHGQAESSEPIPMYENPGSTATGIKPGLP